MNEAFWIVWNPQGRNPTHKHQSEGTAQREAERLAGLNPGQSFFVFEAIGVARKVDVEYKRINKGELHPDEIPF